MRMRRKNIHFRLEYIKKSTNKKDGKEQGFINS